MIKYKYYLVFIFIILLIITIAVIYLLSSLLINKPKIEGFTINNPNFLVIDGIKQIYKLDNGNNNYTYFQYFTYTGSIQEFEIPSDVYALNIYCWGAGGGGSIHNTTIIRPYAMYLSDDYNVANKKIPDSSGSNRGDAIVTGTISKSIDSAITQLSGQIDESIRFPNNIVPANFTILTITKYLPGNKNKIISDEIGNWYQGHNTNAIGVSYNGMKTSATGVSANIDDWIVCIGKNEARTTNIDANILINGQKVATTAGGSNPTTLGVNIGSANKNNAWSFGLLIIWDKHLTDMQMAYISDYIHTYRRYNQVFNRQLFVDSIIGRGGTGGYVKTILSDLKLYEMNHGNKMKIVVGGGGKIRRDTSIGISDYIFGGGGEAKTTGNEYGIGTGGGLSGVFAATDFQINTKGVIEDTSVPVVIAGGGGGSGIDIYQYAQYGYEKVIITNPYIHPVNIRGTEDVYIEFTTNSTIEFREDVLCDILMVGGGGSGGAGAGGGGGGGQVISDNDLKMRKGRYEVHVGRGGINNDGETSYIKLIGLQTNLYTALGGEKGNDNGGNGGANRYNIQIGGIGSANTIEPIRTSIGGGGGGSGGRGGGITYEDNAAEFARYINTKDEILRKISIINETPITFVGDNPLQELIYADYYDDRLYLFNIAGTHKIHYNSDCGYQFLVCGGGGGGGSGGNLNRLLGAGGGGAGGSIIVTNELYNLGQPRTYNNIDAYNWGNPMYFKLLVGTGGEGGRVATRDDLPIDDISTNGRNGENTYMRYSKVDTQHLYRTHYEYSKGGGGGSGSHNYNYANNSYTGGGASVIKLDYTVKGGQAYSITVNDQLTVNGGSGYTNPPAAPTIRIDGGGAGGGAAFSYVSQDSLDGTGTKGGDGCISNPTINYYIKFNLYTNPSTPVVTIPLNTIFNDNALSKIGYGGGGGGLVINEYNSIKGGSGHNAGGDGGGDSSSFITESRQGGNAITYGSGGGGASGHYRSIIVPGGNGKSGFIILRIIGHTYRLTKARQELDTIITTPIYSKIKSGNGGLSTSSNIKGTNDNPSYIYLGGGGSGGAPSSLFIGSVDERGGGGLGGIGNNRGNDARINSGGGGGGGGKTSLLNMDGGNGGSGLVIIRLKNFNTILNKLNPNIDHGGNGGTDNGLNGNADAIGGSGGSINSGGASGQTTDISPPILGDTYNGGKYRGGNGYRNHAGGGGGYYGGGCSGNIYNNANEIIKIGGGGGGSSFVNSIDFKVGDVIINNRTSTNGLTNVEGMTDNVYIDGIGAGGYYDNNGGNGLVVIEWFKYDRSGRGNICGDRIKAYINRCEGYEYIKKPSELITNIDRITLDEREGGYSYRLGLDASQTIISFSSYYANDVTKSPLCLFDGNRATFGSFGNYTRFSYNSGTSSGDYLDSSTSKYPHRGIHEKGEWLEIIYPEPIIIGKYTFIVNKNNLFTAVGKWCLYAITDINEVILLDKVDNRVSGNKTQHYYYDEIAGDNTYLSLNKYICTNELSCRKYVFIFMGLAQKYTKDSDYRDGGYLSFNELAIYELTKASRTIVSTYGD